jgi:hypothetical protein
MAIEHMQGRRLHISDFSGFMQAVSVWVQYQNSIEQCDLLVGQPKVALFEQLVDVVQEEPDGHVPDCLPSKYGSLSSTMQTVQRKKFTYVSIAYSRSGESINRRSTSIRLKELTQMHSKEPCLSSCT